MEKQLVVFELAGEHYGVDISAVESIVKMQAITVIPQAPYFVEGLTNLRGAVLPVIDLRKRFGLPQVELTNNHRIIVAAVKGIKTGMIVDGVSEVLSIQDEMVEPPPALVLSIDTAFIVGIARLDSRLVILLDLSRVISQGEQALLEALPAAG